MSIHPQRSGTVRCHTYVYATSPRDIVKRRGQENDRPRARPRDNAGMRVYGAIYYQETLTSRSARQSNPVLFSF